MKSSRKSPGFEGKSCKSLFPKFKNAWCNGCKEKKGRVQLKDAPKKKKKAKKSKGVVLAAASLSIIPRDPKRVQNFRDWYQPAPFYQRPLPLNAEKKGYE